MLILTCFQTFAPHRNRSLRVKRHFLCPLMKYEALFPQYWGSGVPARYSLLAPQLQHMVRLWWISYPFCFLKWFLRKFTEIVSAGGGTGKGSCCEASVRHDGIFFECTEPAAVLKREKAAGTETFMLTRIHTEQAALVVCFLAFTNFFKIHLMGATSCQQLWCCVIIFLFLLFWQQLL